MKSPFNLGFAALIRLYFPGLFFSALTFPAFSGIFKKIDFLAGFAKPEYIALEAIFWGILIYALDDTIYQIFEGRILWPDFLSKRGYEKEQTFIKDCLDKINKLREENKREDHEYTETWYRLRVFPQNKKSEYYAESPTRLGNIIQGYELYPKSRYGIDAVFYWYRIWLTLDKNVKEEIDNESARADFGVYSSFLFYVSFILHLIFCGIKLCQDLGRFSLFPLPSWQTLLLISGISFLLGFLFYKLSCPLHRFYGEYFKTLFDLNKNSVLEMSEGLDESAVKRIEHVARYLQYYKIKCPDHECGELNPGNAVKCKKCGIDLPRVFQKVEGHQAGGPNKKKSAEEATIVNKFFNLFKSS
jgi:ribosomal protein L40E